MHKLTLHFTCEEKPQLVQSEFFYALSNKTLICIRGKFSTQKQQTGTFQWTSAVRALCALFLKAAVYERKQSARQATNDEVPAPSLEGDLGSVASTLDFTISKNPAWLEEMLGNDLSGRPLARRIFIRRNSGHRHTGGVHIVFAPNFLAQLKVQIRIDGREIEDSGLLEHLTEGILNEQRPRIRAAASFRESGLPFVDEFRERLRWELFSYLSDTTPLTRIGTQRILQSVCSNSSYRRLVRRAPQMLFTDDPMYTEIDAELNSQEAAAAQRILEKQALPVRLCSTTGPHGTLAILLYMQHVLRYHVEIDYQLPHTAALAQQVLQHNYAATFDLIGVSTLPWARLLSADAPISFKSIMFLPAHRFRIVSPIDNLRRTGDPINYGRFLFLRDIPSAENFYFSALQEHKVISSRDVAIEHCEPPQAFIALHEGDPDVRAISFFPHYYFNQRFNNCRLLDLPNWDGSIQYPILLGSKEFLADHARARAFLHLFFATWRELSLDPRKLDPILDRLVTNSSYIKTLRLCCGLTDDNCALPSSTTSPVPRRANS